MRIILIYTISIFSIFLSCLNLLSYEIAGKVSIPCSHTQTVANITVTSLTDSIFEQIYSVDEKGNFQLNLQKPGFYAFNITGISSEHHNFLYYCDANQSNTFININLPPINYPNDTFFVLGNFNDFEFDYKHKMEKISDDEYEIEIYYPKDTLIYQIYYYDHINEYGRSFNGNQNNETYKLDKAGDYYSIMVDKQPNKIIRFKKCSSVNSYLSNIVVDFKNDILNQEFYNFQEKISKRKKLFDYSTALEENGNSIDQIKKKLNDFVEELENDMDYYKAIFDTTKNIAIKKYIAAYIVNHFSTIYLLNCSKLLKSLKIKMFLVKNQSSFINETINLVEITSPLREYLKYSDGIIFATCLLYENTVYDINKTFLNYLSNSKNIDYKMRELQKAILYYKYDNYNEKLFKYYSGLFLTLFPDDIFVEFLLKHLKSAELRNNPLPKFTVSSLYNSNKAISSKELKGKYTLVVFWSTYCGPCLKEIPKLMEAKRKFPELNILMISFDTDTLKVQQFASKRFTEPCLHGIEPQSFLSNIAQTFEIISIPYLILVDPNLKIVATTGELLGDRLFITLDKTLNKQLKYLKQ